MAREITFGRCVKIVFISIGAKFYMDWLLPTNWGSKNPLFKFLWSFKPKYLPLFVNSRFVFAFIYGGIHLCFLGIDIFCHWFDWLDVVVNIYPIIVNLYIGYRCWKVKDWKTYLDKKLRVNRTIVVKYELINE